MEGNAENRNLEYYRQNAEEDYMHTPISVLKYISELEAALAKFNSSDIIPIGTKVKLADFGEELTITSNSEKFGGEAAYRCDYDSNSIYLAEDFVIIK